MTFVAGTAIPILSRSPSPIGSTSISLTQAPIQPWANDEEAEEYARDARAFLLAKSAEYRATARLFLNRVMLATYYLPAFQDLPDGHRWHRTDTTLAEATVQGKVGLVIAKGALAFKDDPERGLCFNGDNVEIGDWVEFDIHHGLQRTIRRLHCRCIKDVDIISVIPDPMSVY